MSRIGKKPIPLPPGVQVEIKGNEVSVKGAKGELNRSFPNEIAIAQKDGHLEVSRPSDSRQHKSLHGLARSLLANMVQGVSQGFEKELELSGVGYRAQVQAGKLTLNLGYSHPVEYTPPPGITLAVEGTNKIKVKGIDKEMVGEVAARLRRVRPPDAYKGKGVRYAGERVRLKPGKSGKATAKK